MSDRRVPKSVVISAALSFLPMSGAAQVVPACPFVGDPTFPDRGVCVTTESVRAIQEPPSLSPGKAFLYSALLPGASQRKLGQRRWLAYVAVEAISWVVFGRARSSAAASRDQYRDRAWDVARTFGETREDGDFPYYETLAKFESSGSFDADATLEGIQPQLDPATYNGVTWQLARQVFFPDGPDPAPGDPQYEAALEYYRGRAYDERFEWDWGERAGDWVAYQSLIESSDADFRRASEVLGVVIANHFLSGVDGFVSARLRAVSNVIAGVTLRLQTDRTERRLGLVLRVRL